MRVKIITVGQKSVKLGKAGGPTSINHIPALNSGEYENEAWQQHGDVTHPQARHNPKALPAQRD